MKRLAIIFTVLFVILIVTNISKGDTPQYQITDLGPGCACSINNNDQVVGSFAVLGGSPWGSAILFDTTGQGNNMNMGNGVACSINDSGQAVGVYRQGSTSQAINYKPNPNGTYIAEAMGNYSALSINNNGQMVGKSEIGAVIFTYNESSHTYETTSLNGVTGGGIAYSNNGNGQIAGELNDRAIIWNSDGSGGYVGTTLGTISDYATRSEAKSINNSGQIVGNAYTIFPDNVYRAVLFDETGGGQNINLGSLSGCTDSWANSINDNGQIVGACFNEISYWVNDSLATLFDPTGGGDNINLNTVLVNPLSGWTLKEAYSINEDGWIVGYMNHSTLGQHAFLLTPVPEPAMIVLLGLGGLMLRKRI